MALGLKKIFPLCNVIFFISDRRYFLDYIYRNELKEKISEFKLIFLSNIVSNLESDSYWGECDWKGMLRNDVYNHRDVINCDRRLKYGKSSQFDRIFSKQFSESEQERILRRIAYSFTSALIDGKSFGVSFACNIVTDMFLALCKIDNYIFYNIRSARFKNYIFIEKQINDPTPEFIESFKIKYETLTEINNDLIISEIEGRYEGVQQEVGRVSAKPLKNIFSSIFSRLFVKDHHCELSFVQFYTVIARLKLRKLPFFKCNFFGARLPENFFIFPLHAEPEVSLDVYSRFSLSQVELVEKFSASLPLGVYLVCKEHPWMVGRFNGDVFKRLSRLSNVCFVPSHIDLESLVCRSMGLVSFCGSTGLLALKHRKPLFIFGESYFSVLCDRMVWTDRNPQGLTEKRLQKFVNNYQFDAKGVIALLETIKDRGFQINLYSGLLRRKEALAYSPIQEDDQIATLVRAVSK
ncbi:hypothetical protein N9W31_00685 [Litoricolaceae bacterium]|nr:hypothetical protein [Litorivicinaceae bacterium]